MAEEAEIVSEQRGNVLVLRINRPEARNALNSSVMAGIGKGITDAETDPGIRAVVLTGTGDRAFCAGMDLRAFARGEIAPTAEEQRHMGVFMRFMSRGEASVPVVGGRVPERGGGSSPLVRTEHSRCKDVAP